jgi:hypothetical protein
VTWSKKWRRNWRLDNRHNWRGPEFEAEFGGTTTGGVATFVLALENLQVQFKWITDVIPAASGLEQRRARNNRAKETYSGQAWLLGDLPRNVRTTLAKYAARGETFLLALPHEELLLSDDADGTVLPIDAAELALTDWTRVGQRVVVYAENEDGEIESIDAVIQAVGADTITLDIDPGELGAYGARIAPARAIHFEPTQDFGRIETADEEWSIKAHAVDFDYALALASLDLGPLTNAAALANASVTERYPGACSSFEMSNTGLDGLGHLDETGEDVLFEFVSAGFLITTVDDLYNALSTSTRLAPTGTWGTGENLTAGDVMDEELAGGATQTEVGVGATLTEYDGKPVWERPIRLAGTATETMHALTKIIDFGGKPYAKGFADMADWGRPVGMLSADRYDWQWFKRFMTEVAGSAKTWWLPSWRDDLPFVSKAANTITVEGDVDVWFPAQRQHVEIEETDGTRTRAEITEAVDNGDGTWTLTIGTTLASSSVRRVSWLELCRFERDQIDVSFGQHGFSFSTLARVVQA